MRDTAATATLHPHPAFAPGTAALSPARRRQGWNTLHCAIRKPLPGEASSSEMRGGSEGGRAWPGRSAGCRGIHARNALIGRFVHEESQQRRGSAEGAPRDAMVAGPAAVFVLRVGERLLHLRFPRLPILAATVLQALPEVHVAEEFLAPVVPKTSHVTTVDNPGSDCLLRRGGSLLVLGKLLQFLTRPLLDSLGGRGIFELLLRLRFPWRVRLRLLPKASRFRRFAIKVHSRAGRLCRG